VRKRGRKKCGKRGQEINCDNEGIGGKNKYNANIKCAPILKCI
jgi:hypothetical protein